MVLSNLLPYTLARATDATVWAARDVKFAKIM